MLKVTKEMSTKIVPIICMQVYDNYLHGMVAIVMCGCHGNGKIKILATLYFGHTVGSFACRPLPNLTLAIDSQLGSVCQFFPSSA